MLRLIIEDDEGKTTVVPLIRDEITIGRKEGNTIRLTERNVSRRHARLLRTGEGADHTVIVEDLDSYNGIRLNGDKVAGKCTMRPGDLVQIGDYSLALQVDPPTGATGDQPAIKGDPATIVAATRVGDEAATALHRVDDTDILPAEQQGRLVVVSSNLGGETYVLGRREIILGRTDENDVVVNHRSISRNHAKVVVRDGQFTIIDLASSNGVRVNGEPFGTVTLVNGDIIELGHVKLRFVAPGEHYVFTPADIDDVEVEGQAGGTGKLVLIALLLAAVAVLTFFLVRPPASKPTETPKVPASAQSAAPPSDTSPVDVTKLLAEGEGHLSGEAWSEAKRVFERVLQATPNNEQARNGVERATREAEAQQLFERLRGAAEQRQWADAYTGLEHFPPGSVYSPRAVELQKKIEPDFAASELERGRGLVQDGELDAAQVIQKDLATRGLPEAEKLAKDIKAAEGKKPAVPASNGLAARPSAAAPQVAEPAEPAAPSEPAPAVQAPNAGGDDKQAEYEALIDDARKRLVRGDRDGSVAQWEKALKLRPDSKLPYQNLCSIYKARHNFEKAIPFCKKWLARETSNYKSELQKLIDEMEADLNR